MHVCVYASDLEEHAASIFKSKVRKIRNLMGYTKVCGAPGHGAQEGQPITAVAERGKMEPSPGQKEQEKGKCPYLGHQGRKWCAKKKVTFF
jgi:hypothetical protein